MNCPKCSTLLPENSKFCLECGAAITREKESVGLLEQNASVDGASPTSLSSTTEVPTNEVSNEELFARGKEYYERKDYQKSQECFQSLVERNPKHGLYLAWLARVYWALDDLEQAVILANRAEEVDPELALTQEVKGRIFFNKDDMKNAVLHFLLAHELGTTDKMSLAMAAMFYLTSEKYDEALEICNSQIELEPDDASHYKLRGTIYKRRGDESKAREDFRKAIGLDPSLEKELEDHVIDPEVKARERNTGITISIVFGAFVLWAILQSFIPELICSIGIAVIAGFSVLMAVSAGQCPSCNALLARRQIDRTAIGSRTGYKTVKREQTDSQGNVIRRWDEQVRVKETSFRHDYQCSICNHTWSATSTKETQDFYD